MTTQPMPVSTVPLNDHRDALLRKVQESASTTTSFFDKYADQLLTLSEIMAGALLLLHVLWDMIHLKLGEEDVI